jgi:hypothetical protein
MKNILVFLFFATVSNLVFAELKLPLYCGVDHYGCEDRLIDTVIIESVGGKLVLKRIFKQGDNPWELTFTGKKLSEGEESEFILDSDKSTFADGKYSKGTTKIKVVCKNGTKKGCTIISSGNISGWHSKKKPNKKLKGVDDIKPMDFKLACNSKSIVTEEPGPNDCGE